ncbi:MAG: hypothetical protein OXN83_01955, partial [Oligoflexia bacterium]|nr:hypothetical protein [Oligoflexia bacterium]
HHFLKTDSPKHIILTNKKTAEKTLYYLQKWGKTNLYLISRASRKASLYDFVFSDSSKSILALTLVFVLFALSLLACWRQFFVMASSYKFLKSAFIFFSEYKYFPSPQSKNPLLYFYNNRYALLNKKEQLEKEKDKAKTKSFQKIIEEELEKLKSQYPNIITQENFSSNVKVFGFERFLRTIIHELLLNALESMGAMKK